MKITKRLIGISNVKSFGTCIKWQITVNNFTFDYHQGLGHLKLRSRINKEEIKNYAKIDIYFLKDNDNDEKILAEIANCLPRTDKRRFIALGTESFYRIVDFKSIDCIMVKIPSDLDLLHCLKSDSECGNMSFSEFCDNLGYSNDSLQALDYYRQCEEVAKHFRGFNWSKELEDY